MIYKYRAFDSEYKFQIFIDGEVYFSRPSQFNDPFEMKPKIIGLDTLNERKVFVDRFVQKNLKNLSYKQRNVEKRKALIRLSNNQQVEADIHALLEDYGVFSTSRNWDHILMWSHYSNSHKGFCVGFDFDEEFDKEVGMPIVVSYSDWYPMLSPHTLDDHNELFKSTVGSKSSVWAYEEEIRYVKSPREGGNGLHKISKNRIKEVILGACISDKDSADIRRVLLENNLAIKLFQAKVSNSKYILERQEISG